MAETNAEGGGRPITIGWNRQTALDVLFVLILPVACLVLDPGVLSVGSDPLFTGLFPDFQLPAYILIGILIAGFWATFLPALPSLAKRFLRGTLILGFVVSGAFTLVLLPFIPVAFFMVPALVAFGFAPPLIAYRYFRRFRTLKSPESRQKSSAAPVVAGFLTPLAITVFLHIGILISQERFLEDSFKELSASEYEDRLIALQSLASYPLCLSVCRRRVVMLYCRDEIAVPRDVFLPLFFDNSGGVLRSDGTCFAD